MVTKDRHMPVWSRCYQGNQNDIPACKTPLTPLMATAKRLTQGPDVTLVFDTGKVSKEVRKRLQEELYVVPSLGPSDHEDRLQECRDQRTWIRPKSKAHEAILAYVTTQRLWGKDHKRVIGYSPAFFAAQQTSLLRQRHKAETQRREIQKTLAKVETQKRDRAALVADRQTQIAKVWPHDNLHSLMTHTLSGRKYLPVVFQVDEDK